MVQRRAKHLSKPHNRRRMQSNEPYKFRCSLIWCSGKENLSLHGVPAPILGSVGEAEIYFQETHNWATRHVYIWLRKKYNHVTGFKRTFPDKQIPILRKTHQNNKPGMKIFSPIRLATKSMPLFVNVYGNQGLRKLKHNTLKHCENWKELLNSVNKGNGVLAPQLEHGT